MCRLINLSKPTRAERISESTNSLNALLRELSGEQQLSLRAQLLTWQNADISSSSAWSERIEEVKAITSMFGITQINREFSSWSTPHATVSHTQKATDNLFTYVEPETERSVDIELCTIHSVKGETHFVTLLLETFYKKHNIISVIDLLCGCSRKKSIGKEDEYRMKCNYVALTRAKGLVCIALPSDSLRNEEAQALNNIGWQIVRL